jgi:competence protein ComFB
MDYLKNTLEEIVVQKIEQAFPEYRDNCQCLQCRKDATVFILNNLKPRYIISTRGMLHEMNNTSERTKVEKEIEDLLPEALTRVNEHRRPNFEHGPDNGSLSETLGHTERFTMTDGYQFNFPFFIGEVCDADGKPLSNVQVTLLIDGQTAEGWDGNWPNPYETSEKSGGKFAFWPRPLPASRNDGDETREMAFATRLSTPGHEDRIIEFSISMESQKFIINFVRKDFTKDLGRIQM